MKNLQNYTSFINEGKSNNNDSKLLNAAETGDIEELTRLLKIVDVNLQDKDCWTALMFAALNGYIDCVKLLVDNNADVNLQDKDGWTALMRAAVKGKTDCVKLLIKNGSLVDIHDNGNETALKYNCVGVWKNSEVQEDIINLQPWNIKFFDDRIGFLPELKVKYKDAFIISDINI